VFLIDRPLEPDLDNASVGNIFNDNRRYLIIRSRFTVFLFL